MNMNHYAETDQALAPDNSFLPIIPPKNASVANKLLIKKFFEIIKIISTTRMLNGQLTLQNLL